MDSAQPSLLDGLYKKAAELAGRPVEVMEITTVRHAVLWMRFGVSPPPAGSTEAEALELFIEMMERIKRDDADSIPELDASDLAALGIREEDVTKS